MKKSILAMALTTVLGVSGAAFADTGAAPHTTGSTVNCLAMAYSGQYCQNW